MTKWLWYINAAVVFLAVLTLFIGLTQLSDYPFGQGQKDYRTTGADNNGQPSDDNGVSQNRRKDSPLVAAARIFSHRLGPAIGYITVTIVPEQAVKDGAVWRLDKLPWQKSGETVKNVKIGEFNLDFKPLDGWNVPGKMSVKILRDETVIQTATYKAKEYGLLTVMISPKEPAELGAQWRIGELPWQKSGATLAKVPVGSNTIQFKGVPDWNPPPQMKVEIIKDQTSTATAEFIKEKYGSIKLKIVPTEAAEAGVQWQIKGGQWNNSEATIDKIKIGPLSIEFKSVPDWNPPKPMTVDITEDQTATVSAEFIKEKYGSIKLKIVPEEVAKAGAQWRFKGGSWNNSEAVAEKIDVGVPLPIEFKDVKGWAKPEALTVTVADGEVTEAEVSYKRVINPPPAPKFTLSGTIFVPPDDGYAILRVPGEKEDKTFFVGEEIADGYKLKSVADGSVVVTKEGFEYTLKSVEQETKPEAKPETKTEAKTEAKPETKTRRRPTRGNTPANPKNSPSASRQRPETPPPSARERRYPPRERKTSPPRERKSN